MITKAESEKHSVAMTPAEFRNAGYLLVDKISQFLEELPQKPVTTAETPLQIRKLLKDELLPEEGAPASQLLENACKLLFEHSLFNGHPRFWGYITSSPAPIGALAEMLAATVNANVGAFTLSPIATEIERQTISWLAGFIGYPADCEGLFVSGGNMANFIGFLTARKAMIKNDIRKEGLHHIKDIANPHQYLIYCPSGTHTWIQKAADLFGFGTDSIRWIELDTNGKMNLKKLEEQLAHDVQNEYYPLMVVANAGSVSTGVVDDLSAIAGVCKKHNLWFHIDGAYGAPAAGLPENTMLFKGLSEADSIAIDPHKWFYSPIEAGCILVKKKHQLSNAFSFQPEYYNFNADAEEPPINYHEYGMQNSRSFKALKVWLSLQQAGRNGYIKMIRDNIELSQKLYQLCENTEEVEAISHNLSITTFRYVPANTPLSHDKEYLNKLNEKLLNRLQSGGEVFLSNAIVNGQYCLRVCIVNFRTTYPDLEVLIAAVLKQGKLLLNESGL